jgi:pyruvate/2-oxoglutarate dehydrogenase complex dihydrolipoamide dehydrogenase (E3) component
MTHDLLVIGSGQGGGPLAGTFAKAGRRVALIEREHVGGTCINVGCTPTKTMVASARVAYLARRSEDFGVNVGTVRVDLARVRERKQRVVERFRTGGADSLTRAGVSLKYGSARFTGSHTIEVMDATGTRDTLSAPLILIDTGTRPSMPSLEGLERTPFLDSTSIMELTDVPEHLLVLGGGSIGVEFAQMFRRFGSRVTVLQRGAQLMAHEDEDVANEVAKILGADGIHIIVGATALRVTAEERGRLTLDYRAADGARETLSGSHLLVATGRVPNTEALGLAAASVDVDDRGFVKVNERLETTAPGVFALGDVTGEPQFTHVSYDDFRILRTNLLEGGSATTKGRVIPYTIYIDPQLGRIGLTEREARKAGHDVRIARLEMAKVARATEVDETRGFMKAVVDAKTERVLGAAVLGIEGGEIASLIQVAMLGDLPYTALRDGMFAHPTLAEAMNNLFKRFEPQPTLA